MTLTTQFMTMLAMVGMGSVFGAALDTYNRFLKRTKRNRLLVFMNDILFWIVQGLAIFYILFLVNSGELRFYIFIALLCGFAAYQSLFKGVYLRILEILISIVISFYRFLLKVFHFVIYKPIYMLVAAVISLIIMLGKGLLSLLKVVWKLLLFILKIVLLPVQWTFRLIWKLLPKRIKKLVDKIYNKMAGIFKQIKNYFHIRISRWKKDKK